MTEQNPETYDPTESLMKQIRFESRYGSGSGCFDPATELEAGIELVGSEAGPFEEGHVIYQKSENGEWQVTFVDARQQIETEV